jgi:hypothetical protein
MATAPQFHQSSVNILNEFADSSNKISRNKKKKLRKKQKRIETLIEHQEKQIEFIQRENLTLLCTTQEDENKRLSKFMEFSESNMAIVDLDQPKTQTTAEKPAEANKTATMSTMSVDNKSDGQNATLNKKQRRRLKTKAKKQLLKQQQQHKQCDNNNTVSNTVAVDKKTPLATTTSLPEQSHTTRQPTKPSQPQSPSSIECPAKVSDDLENNDQKYNPVTDPCVDENDLQVKIADLGTCIFFHTYFDPWPNRVTITERLFIFLLRQFSSRFVIQMDRK